MITKDSPRPTLRAQAQRIARHLKAAEAGEVTVEAHILNKMALARITGVWKVGIAMNDKTIIIDVPINKLRDTDEADLAEYILGLMMELPDASPH